MQCIHLQMQPLITNTNVQNFVLYYQNTKRDFLARFQANTFQVSSWSQNTQYKDKNIKHPRLRVWQPLLATKFQHLFPFADLFFECSM